MAVIRINKTADYTVMSNAHFKEKEMSLKAKGLLSLMLSLPDSWDYSIAGLVAICKENETAVKSTLNELKSFGYLVVTKKMPNETQSGRIEYEYNIFEQPQGKQANEKQGIENLPVEYQGVENQGQLSTNKPNTKKSKTKRSSTEDSKVERKRFVPPTLEEVQAYCAERKNNVDAKKFHDYFTASNWYDSKGNKVKSWKQKVITWEGYASGNSNGNNRSYGATIKVVNGKEYEYRNGKYYIPNGSGIAVDPWAKDDLDDIGWG